MLVEIEAEAVVEQ